MTDQNNSDNFSFGPVRNVTKTEKENRSPTTRDTAEARRGSKQSRVRFVPGPVDDISSPISANTIPLADASSTSLPASTPLNRSSAAPVEADAAATPVGGVGMPTPAGPMGRGVSLPPTPFAPQSMTSGSSAIASFVAPAWRSRTRNAAFKGRSPSSSRHSSPASSSGVPEYTSPLVSSASRHPFFTEMLSSMSTPIMSSSPLTSPGGRPLGRGLDDSPAISGTSGDSRCTAPLDSGEVLSGVRAASVSPISTPGDATTTSKGILTGSVSRLAPQAGSEAAQQDSRPITGFSPSIGPATSATAQSNDAVKHQPEHMGAQHNRPVTLYQSPNMVGTIASTSGMPSAAVQRQPVSDSMAEASAVSEGNSLTQDPSNAPQPFGSPSAIPLPSQPEQATTTGRLATASPNQAAEANDPWNSLWEEPFDSPNPAAAPAPLPEPDSGSALLPSSTQSQDVPSSLPDKAHAGGMVADLLNMTAMDAGARQQQHQPDEAISALLQFRSHSSGLPDQAAVEDVCDSTPHSGMHLPDQDAVSVSSLSLELSEVINLAAAGASNLQAQEESDLPDQALPQEPHVSDVINIVTESLLQQSSELSNQASTYGTTRDSLPDVATTSGPYEPLTDQATPSQIYGGAPNQTGTPELISSMPDQASTPRLNRSLPDQATTPHLKTRLPELEMLSHIPKGGPARGVSATPKTVGAREYGSWWTPKGLTPAWLKTRTPGWMKKLQQPDMDEELVQPKRLDLRPLTPFLRPKPQLDDLAQQAQEEVPQVWQHPRAAKSTTQIWLPILARLVVFIGAAFGSWRSYESLPMMQLYHHHTDHDLSNTVPYMWSGGPLTGSLELPFTYASDMLPWIALGVDSHHANNPKSRPPVPSQEHIRQSFQFARQQQPQEVDTQFGHAAVDALHAEMQQALNMSGGVHKSVDSAGEGRQSDLGIGFDSEHAVQDSDIHSEQSSTDTDVGHDETASHTASPADSIDSTNNAELSTASSSNVAKNDIAVGKLDATACSGSGAIWTKPEPEATRLEAYLQHNWARAMALARAAQQPISFFSSKQPQPETDSPGMAKSAENAAMSQSAYSPYPVQAEPFSEAWRQASHTGSHLLSSAQAAAESGCTNVLHSLQVGAQQSVSAVQQGWSSTSQYVLTTKAAVTGKSGRWLSWPQRSSSAPKEELDSLSDTHHGQGLADASAQLMQSLDHLLGSLEVPTPDSPDHADLQQQQQHDDHDWMPHQQSLQADAEAEVELSGRATPAAEDSNAYMATPDHNAPPSDKDMTVQSLRRTLWPLAALLAATGGVGLLLHLLRRSPEEHEDYDDDAEEADVSPPVSRRLDSSFANSGARPSLSGTVSNAAHPLARGSDLPPTGPAPNSPEEGTQGPQASFSQRVTRNVQRALSHNGGQTPARHPAQFPTSTSPAVLQGLANAGPSSQPGSRSTVRRSTRLHSHTTAQPIPESQEEVNSLKPGRRSGRQR
ncbi:hypothetical protein WJX77_002236 [Trebouxia sp. C0004]